MTFRRLLLGAAAAALTCPPGPAGAAPAVRPVKTPPFSVRGELVDLVHYLSDRNLRGADHAAAARQGIENGNPPGVLSKAGDLYLLVGRNLHPANSQAAPFAGKQVKVTGKKVTRGKLLAVIVEQIEELPPPTKSKTSKNGKSTRK